MSQPDFDSRAATWDDDPMKVRRAHDIATAIADAVDLQPSMRAMEYGCGTGLVSFALADRLGPILMVDVSEGMLEVAARKIAAAAPRGPGRELATARLDLTVDPLPAQPFDLVFTSMTLHHVPDTAAILGRFHAALAPGGALCIADLDAEDGSFHGPEVDVHHGFERGALATALRDAGFTDVRITTAFTIDRGPRRYPVFLAAARRA